MFFKVTGRGVCRGAVPPLPTMRWRMIAHAIDRERVIACGGVNIFGDPKADCWIMGFNPEPFWTEATRMNIARDAAAWAQVSFLGLRTLELAGSPYV
jgi:hypothetical protein